MLVINRLSSSALADNPVEPFILIFPLLIIPRETEGYIIRVRLSVCLSVRPPDIGVFVPASLEF